MCDGTYLYPQKGGSAKSVTAHIIVCGNKHPRDLYPNTWNFIEARFNVIELGVVRAAVAPHKLIKNKRDTYVSTPTIDAFFENIVMSTTLD